MVNCYSAQYKVPPADNDHWPRPSRCGRKYFDFLFSPPFMGHRPHKLQLASRSSITKVSVSRRGLGLPLLVSLTKPRYGNSGESSAPSGFSRVSINAQGHDLAHIIMTSQDLEAMKECKEITVLFPCSSLVLLIDRHEASFCFRPTGRRPHSRCLRWPR